MGTGIAIVANAVAGMQVRISDTTEDRLYGCRKFIDNWCDKEISKNRMDTPKKNDIL